VADQRASFLFRFLDDLFDAFPQADKDRFAVYWSGLIQVAAGMLQATLETDLGGDAFNIPTFEVERWDQYIVSPDTGLMNVFTETPTLSGLLPYVLANRAVFYNTIDVTNAAGAIKFAEDIAFTGDEEVQLTYPLVIQSTLTVVAGSIAMIEGHDYVVNYELGQVQRTPNTNIPPGQVLNVTYQHATYNLGADYVVDQVNNTVAKVAGSQIPDGVVTVSYVRDQTSGPPLVGTTGSVPSLTQLQDLNQNFTGLLPARVLTVTSPADVAGSYVVTSVISKNVIAVSPPFPATGDADVQYSVDAYPYGIVVDQKIVSIPVLQDRITDPAVVLYEGVDYVVSGGRLGFRAMPPFNTLGPQERRFPIFWAEKTYVDNQTPYRNYGVLINFFRVNSDAYVSALRGLLYAFWTGSTNENLVRGIQILLGLPYAPRAGTIISEVRTTRKIVVAPGDAVLATTTAWTFAAGGFTSDDVGRQIIVSGTGVVDGTFLITQVDDTTAAITATDQPANYTFTGAEVVTVSGGLATLVLRNDRQQDIPITIPLGVSPTVSVGDTVTAFQPLSTGVQIIDKVTEPDFITTRVGIGGIARFFVPGITAEEVTMALVFMREHLFLPLISVSAVQGIVNVPEIQHFLDELKPAWTEYIFGFQDEFEESMSFGEALMDSDITPTIDLTTRVQQDELNLDLPSQIFLSTTGEIVSAAGLLVLQDSADFSPFSFDDTVEIESEPNDGSYRLVQVNGSQLVLWPTPLHLDAPITYRILPKELALSHDAPSFTDTTVTAGSGAVVGGVLTDLAQQFLHLGLQPGMQVLITSGSTPVAGPTYPGLFTLSSVTQTTIGLSQSIANGAYNYQFSCGYIRATAGGSVAGLPLTMAC
jgi:hypothetical protein